MKIGLIAFLSALVLIDSQRVCSEDSNNEVSLKQSFGQAGKHLKQGFKDLGNRSGNAFKKLYCDSKHYFVQSGKTIKANSKQFAVKTKSNFKESYGLKNKNKKNQHNNNNINPIVCEDNQNILDLNSNDDCNRTQNQCGSVKS